MTSIEERYALKRPNFILDPAVDSECFARRDLDIHKLVEKLQVDLVTGMAPKRMYWGPYGGGKTHTLFKTMTELGRLTPIHPVHVECPDMTRRATFLELYRDGVLRQLGEDYVLELLQRALDEIGVARREVIVQRMKEIVGDDELAKAAVRLVDPNFEKLTLWAWISGVKLGRPEIASLGLTQDLTEAEPARLAQMLIFLGQLERRISKKTLVLILDEMERLKAVGPESIVTFVTGFTRLADPNQRHVSLLIGCSAGILNELPDVFALDGAVMSRIGPDDREEIPPMPDPDVESFVRTVIAYLREPTDLGDRVRLARKAGNETVIDDLFPFTTEAIDAVKAKLSRQITPREITIVLTQAAGKAHLADRPMVSSEFV